GARKRYASGIRQHADGAGGRGPGHDRGGPQRPQLHRPAGIATRHRAHFDAEYGNYSGGVVNVVTKSGGNALHGNGFEFLRNTALDARSFFSPERSFYRQNQFGGTIGGPIRQNKVF